MQKQICSHCGETREISEFGSQQVGESLCVVCTAKLDLDLAEFLQDEFAEVAEDFAYDYERYLNLHEALAHDLIIDGVDVEFNTKVLKSIRKELDRIDYNQD